MIGTRAALAAAAGTVDGVTGYAKQPGAYRTGDAWAVWGGSERFDGGLFLTTWRVLVAIPNDEAGADQWIADHLEALIDALQPVAHIDRVDPVLLAGTNDRALQFTARE